MSRANFGDRSVTQCRPNPRASTMFHDEIERECVFMDLRRMTAHGSNECAFDLCAGGDPTSVNDPGQGVAPFAGEFESSVSIAIEPSTDSDEVTNTSRPFLDEHPYGIDIAQPCARGQRVGQMQVGGIGIATEHCGNATLGPSSRRLFEWALGEHADSNSGLGRRPHRRREPGHARTHDEKIEFGAHRKAV